MPDYKSQQFHHEDYGTMMNKYEKHLQYNEKMQEKKKRIRKWTEADQLFEDMLWVS